MNTFLKNSFILIFLFLSLKLTYSQDNKYIDSLKNLLTTEKADTAKVDILNEISWEYSYSVPKECINYGQQAVDLANKAGYYKGLGEGYKNIGNGYKNKGSLDSAILFYNFAVDEYKKIDDKIGIARTINNIGLIHFYQSNYYEGIQELQKALDYAEESGDLKTISICLNNTGLIMYAMKDYDKAIKYYQKSLKIKKELDDKKGISNCNNNIANIYADQKIYKLALVNYMKTLEISKEISDKQGTVMALLNIGQIFFELELYDKSMPYYEEAIEISEETGNKIGIITSYVAFANFDYNDKNYNEAIKKANYALELAKPAKYLTEIKKIYLLLANCYSETGNYKLSNEYMFLYKNLSDSLLKVQNDKNILELEAIYQNEKKEKEIEIQNTKIEKQNLEIKQQKTEKNFIFTALALLLIITIVIYKNFRDKKKANIILNQKNSQINQQNEEIKTQAENLKELNTEILAQSEIIDKKNKDITASIVYAQRIQNAVLPSEKAISTFLSDNFVLFLPRDIVSGDFYWIKKINDLIIVAIADCTGHGVPGAFMSILSIALLNEIVRNREITQSNHVLDELRNQIKSAFVQYEQKSDRAEGLDIAFAVIDKTKNIIDFAGANNPLILVRNKELFEYKADKQPVSKFPVEKPFTNHIIEVQKNDIFYMFSDGFASQFGGEKNEKYKISGLKNFLLEISHLDLSEQKIELENEFIKWKGYKNQLDDILVFGFRY